MKGPAPGRVVALWYAHESHGIKGRQRERLQIAQSRSFFIFGALKRGPNTSCLKFLAPSTVLSVIFTVLGSGTLKYWDQDPRQGRRQHEQRARQYEYDYSRVMAVFRTALNMESCILARNPPTQVSIINVTLQDPQLGTFRMYRTLGRRAPAGRYLLAGRQQQGLARGCTPGFLLWFGECDCVFLG